VAAAFEDRDGFTIAHSVTLSLAATASFRCPPRLVEPVIALSIIAVAATNLRARKVNEASPRRDLRPWLALGFGLIHGFGFAGAWPKSGCRASRWAGRWGLSTLGSKWGRRFWCCCSRLAGGHCEVAAALQCGLSNTAPPASLLSALSGSRRGVGRLRSRPEKTL
jgi:hypothetical protein